MFCDVKSVQSAENQLTFRRNTASPSGSAYYLFRTVFLVGLYFDHEYGDMFLRNVGWLSTR
jgi:hypothetical protein